MSVHRDLRLLVRATLVCAIGSLIVPLGPVRLVFAVPLALLAPGYALTAAAFGSRRPDRLEWVPLTLGVSLACLALGGLILNYAPGGIGGLAWTVLLVLIVLRGCAVAARRRGPVHRRGRDRRKPGPAVRLRPGPATAVLAVGALAMGIAALVLTQTTVEADHVDGFTQLWIAPPRPAAASARIGVTSEQQQSRAYRLVIDVGDRSSPMVHSFMLEPGQTHTATIRSGSESPVRFEARLYVRGHPHRLYRRAFAWLPGHGPGALGLPHLW